MPFTHRFVSSDLYKVMEGAAYLLNIEPDPALEAQMDELITIIGKRVPRRWLSLCFAYLRNR